MLVLDQLHLRLGSRQWLFDGIMDTHGIYALLGKSGSGKSSLLNVIAGFIEPNAGTVRWHQQDLNGIPPAERPVTSLFQQNNLFAHLTVEQNIGLGLHPGLDLRIEQRQAITDMLDRVGLSGKEKSRPRQLSGGEQQRVALARCLLRQKPVLLLDEPFSALDSTTRQEMIGLLHTLLKQLKPCVLMVTHDENDACALDATVLRMQDDGLHIG